MIKTIFKGRRRLKRDNGGDIFSRKESEIRIISVQKGGAKLKHFY